MREIDKYMTPAEAAYKWSEKPATVRARLRPDYYGERIDDMIERGLIKCFIKPDGDRKEWIISIQAMEEWFGKKP